MGVERENQTGSLEEKPLSIVYITYDFFEIFPVVGLEVFVSSCEVLSIGWCEPGKGTQLNVICHAPKSRTVVSSLVSCIMPKGEMPKVLLVITWVVP